MRPLAFRVRGPNSGGSLVQASTRGLFADYIQCHKNLNELRTSSSRAKDIEVITAADDVAQAILEEKDSERAFVRRESNTTVDGALLCDGGAASAPSSANFVL